MVSLYPYQTDVVRWMHSVIDDGYKGGILAMLMGLGKTVCALEYLTARLSGSKGKHAVIAAPKSVIVAWMKIHGQFYKEKLDVRFVENRARLIIRRFTASDRPQVSLVTFNCLYSMQHCDFRYFNVVIIDEAHAFVGKSGRSRHLHNVSAYMRELWLLTGTPIRNTSDDMRTLLSYLVRFKAWESSWEVPKILKDIGITTIDDPRTPFKTHGKDCPLEDTLVYKCTYADANQTLPPLHVHVQRFELSKYERLAYTYVSQMLLDNPLQRMMWQRMVVQMPGKYIREMAAKKDDWLSRKLNELVPDDGSGVQVSSKILFATNIITTHVDEPIVVFSTSKQVLDALKERIELCDSRSVSFVHGKLDIHERHAELEEWEDSRGILLITMGTGGEGLTLTSSARCIHMDPWWCPATIDQATARLWRIGQTKPVHVHCLLAARTIESRQIWHCNRKDSIYRKMLGEGFKWSSGDDETIIEMARVNEDTRDDTVADVDHLPTDASSLDNHPLMCEVKLELSLS